MKITLLYGGLMLIIGLSGCAGTVAKKTVEEPIAVIQLECRSTYRHGCRHLGQVLPWEQWIEAKGYSNENYEIINLETSGTMSTVDLRRR